MYVCCRLAPETIPALDHVPSEQIEAVFEQYNMIFIQLRVILQARGYY